MKLTCLLGFGTHYVAVAKILEEKGLGLDRVFKDIIEGSKPRSL